MTTSRKDIRDRLTAVLTAGVPSAQQVLPYYANDFGGISPTILVISSGSLRPPLSARGRRLSFYFAIHIYVAAGVSDIWTDQQAEDLLDQLEVEVWSSLADVDVQSGLWDGIEQTDPSFIDKVTIRDPYLFEAIPLRIEVLR